MRYLVIDELQAGDVGKLAEHLAQSLETSSLPDVFWLNMPEDLLTEEQAAHDDCTPHRVAVVLEPDGLRIELLVRGHGRMRCSCFAYAQGAARDYLIGYLDRLIEELELAT